MLFNWKLVLVASGLANALSLGGSKQAEETPCLATGADATEREANLSGFKAGGLSLTWNALDYELIRNTLSRYAYSMDEKDYAGLSTVYTEDVKVYYPDPVGLIAGLDIIKTMTKPTLEAVTTQHSLSSQSINMVDYWTATVKTYGRVMHFGTGELADQSVTLYLKYEDKVVKVNDDGLADWRITERKISYQGPPVGNASLIAVGK
ncbi:hypothetical protein FDECE_1790 [Fusarium decemcellulare]|nr:hypothetical protein FDECE_1790 [Fusarium decemcellulare]